MNFLLHRHLAFAALGSEAAGIGAMLPDLWRMADRRVRPAPAALAAEALGDADDATRDVMRGIEHHLEADLWFHDADVFTLGERATAAALRGAGTSAKKLTLFAHPLWEMCLDGALVRRLGAEVVRAAVERGFSLAAHAIRRAAHAHHFAHVESRSDRAATTPLVSADPDAEPDAASDPADALHARMEWIAAELSRGPWIEGYSRPEGLVRGLAGMRRRFALPPFSDEERDRLTAAIAPLAGRADAAVEEILARPPSAPSAPSAPPAPSAPGTAINR